MLLFVFAWFAIGGAAHFLATGFFVGIVPPYVPSPTEVVLFTGILELVGAFGLLFALTRQLAGNGLILLVICVTPANVHMWLNPEQFPEIAPPLLAARLGLQILLLIAIWWSTRPRPGAEFR